MIFKDMERVVGGGVYYCWSEEGGWVLLIFCVINRITTVVTELSGTWSVDHHWLLVKLLFIKPCLCILLDIVVVAVIGCFVGLM